MDFDLTDDQHALQAGIRQFCDDRFPPDVARRFGETGGFDRAAWQELAALGTFAIALAEENGGVGLATIDAVLVHEVLGGALVPGPLVASTLAAGLVDGVLDGRVVPAVLNLSAHDGIPHAIEHLRDADVLLIVADDGVRVVETAAVKAEVVEHPLDPTTPVSMVTDLPAGEQVADTEESMRLRTLGSLLSSALLVGIAARVTEISVQYAKDRRQFDRPIGSFQAVQHMLADAFAVTEIARASVHAAGVIVDDPEIADVARAVAGARVLSALAARDNTRTCIQVHGGIGVTWEFDAHLYLKRAWVLMTAFGSADTAAEIVAHRIVADAAASPSLT